MWQFIPMKKKGIVLYDETKPGMDPVIFDIEEFTKYLNSYPPIAQQHAVQELLSGRKRLTDLGPLKNDHVAKKRRLPAADRVIPVDQLGETLRGYPDAWTKQAAKKIVAGELTASGKKREASNTEEIVFEVTGLPPKKAIVPLGEKRHRHHKRFLALRKAAEAAMAGREPLDGPFILTVVLPPEESRTETGPHQDYAAAVMESLTSVCAESSSYPAIVYIDDAQIAELLVGIKPFDDARYQVRIYPIGD